MRMGFSCHMYLFYKYIYKVYMHIRVVLSNKNIKRPFMTGIPLLNMSHKHCGITSHRAKFGFLKVKVDNKN